MLLCSSSSSSSAPLCLPRSAFYGTTSAKPIDVYRYHTAPLPTAFSFVVSVDVLSEPFDAITRTLLERQGQRRLIGFMGAAAVAAASRGECYEYEH